MKSVFSLRDIKAQAWLDPFFSVNTGTMLRDLVELVRSGRIPELHLADLELFEVGTFCTESGRLTPRDPKHVICLSELNDESNESHAVT